ncbi:hypothetical protein M378DRAFT_967586 [Amanita muscaria Koide BX008]|uniref:Uncharacterized protein n=1 Tax=Amanita muscaria (strain Koide BX008) TaxID=946122 RepID=A0A0C2WST3_AMAMK|nr:hypothetical protein M378DRAFT_967586 [Amanita muscaria Koide BX008]
MPRTPPAWPRHRLIPASERGPPFALYRLVWLFLFVSFQIKLSFVRIAFSGSSAFGNSQTGQNRRSHAHFPNPATRI